MGAGGRSGVVGFGAREPSQEQIWRPKCSIVQVKMVAKNEAKVRLRESNPRKLVINSSTREITARNRRVYLNYTYYINILEDAYGC